MRDAALDLMSDIIVFDKYAKYIPSLKRRETWAECVARNEQMHLNRFKDYPDLLPQIREAYKYVYEKKVVPSMRSLQFAGKAIELNNFRMFNCCFAPFDHVDMFSELMFLLLGGSGVGYSVQKSHVRKLPHLIGPQDTAQKFLIGDSCEGWADAVKVLVEAYFFNKPNPRFDYRDIRQKGSLLVTSGGRAPGPEPLRRCLDAIRGVLDGAIGRKLTPLEVHDIACHIAEAVRSGGIRRAAMISFFSVTDAEMMDCKSNFQVVSYKQKPQLVNGGTESYDVEYIDSTGTQKEATVTFFLEFHGDDIEMMKSESRLPWYHFEPQRALSNNSAMFLRHRIRKKDFFDFWRRVEDTGSGDPGISLTNNKECGANPCIPETALLKTKQGLRQLKDVEIGDYIWSETGWTNVINKWSTGVKAVYKYQTTAGSFVGTCNHRIVSGGEKIEVGRADSIDTLAGPEPAGLTLDPQDIMDGLMIGDGSTHLTSHNNVFLVVGQDDQDYFNSEIAPLIGPPHGADREKGRVVETTVTYSELPVTWQRSVPDRFFYGDEVTVRGFLRGLYSANGSICGRRVTLKSTSFTIIEQVQQLLSSLGIRSYYTTNKPSLIEHHNGVYESRESYDLNITVDRGLFEEQIGFLQGYKNEKLREAVSTTKPSRGKTTYDIISVEYLGEMEVFDITVDNAPHTFWNNGLNVSNCHEASLIPGGACNLTEVNCDGVQTQEELNARVAAAAFIGTLQASYTDFHYVRPMWKEACEKDALLGVSLTGQASCDLGSLNLEEAARIAVEVNEKVAKPIGINPAARVTLGKPSGTAALAMGTSSGCHGWYAKRYIRRIYMTKGEPLCEYLMERVPELFEELVSDKTGQSVALCIPIQAPDGAILANEEPALEFLERVKRLHVEWIKPGHRAGDNPHNISATCYVGDDEWGDVGAWLWNNREYLCGLSVLPRGGGSHKQTPFEEIDEDTYNDLAKHVKKIDLTQVVEEFDLTSHHGEVACAGGACDF